MHIIELLLNNYQWLIELIDDLMKWDIQYTYEYTGSVNVDVAIDQGGCVETSKPTTHANPTYLVDDVVHYCVANMPGGVPRTSTMALNKATLPLLIKLADQGYKKTLTENKNYLAGLNVYRGNITFKGVSNAFNLKYTPASDLLKN